jgi:hypothetical protein
VYRRSLRTELQSVTAGVSRAELFAPVRLG